MYIQRTYVCTFEAAHIIEGHPKCGRKHGHSYKLELWFTGDTNKWVDFAKIKRSVDAIIKKYDHHDLGNITAEEIAGQIGVKLSKGGWQGILHLNETAKFGVVMSFGKAVFKKGSGFGELIYASYK